MWNPFKKKKKKKLEDLDLSWFKESLMNDDTDLDDDLQKISDELGIPKSELDLNKIIELCEIKFSDEDSFEEEIEYPDIPVKEETKILKSIIDNRINDLLIPLDQLDRHFLKIINSNEVERRTFLQQLYISNVENNVELTSTLFHLLELTEYSESKLYIIKILPRCHNELSFLICLHFSLKNHRELQKRLPLYDNERLFYEFTNPNFSQLIIDILYDLKNKHSIKSLGSQEIPLFEYLSLCYTNNLIDLNDNLIELLFYFYKNFDEHVSHSITSLPIMSNFVLSQKSFQFHFQKLKDILKNYSKGEYPTFSNDGNNDNFFSFNNCIREIKNILSHIENIPGYYDKIENIYQLLLDGEYFPEKNHGHLTREGVENYIIRGRRKQKRMFEGKTKKYKNPSWNYSSFGLDENLFKPPIKRITFQRTLDEGLDFSEQTKEYLTNLENTIRKEFGLPDVGEQWKSETELYYMISKFLDKKNIQVLFHYRPEFLDGLELDIYFEIEDQKVGIEYQGLQHFQPIEFFGGEESFKKVVERDRRKMDLCRKNNVLLIYYNYDEEISLDIVKKKFQKNNIELN